MTHGSDDLPNVTPNDAGSGGPIREHETNAHMFRYLRGLIACVVLGLIVMTGIVTWLLIGGRHHGPPLPSDKPPIYPEYRP